MMRNSIVGPREARRCGERERERRERERRGRQKIRVYYVLGLIREMKALN